MADAGGLSQPEGAVGGRTTAGESPRVRSDEKDSDDKSKRNRKVCFLFLKSKCLRGDSCGYSHDVSEDAKKGKKAQQKCTNFMKGKCKHGDSCRFIHDMPGEAEAVAGDKRKAASQDVPCGEGLERRTKRSGGLNVPIPLGAAGSGSTLLKKLLQEQIDEEENILLQCIRHLKRNNYLIDVPNTEEASTTLSPEL